MKYLNFLIILYFLIYPGCQKARNSQNPISIDYNSHRAYRDIEKQVSFGSRAVGTPGHQQTLEWIVNELKDAGWHVELQVGMQMGQRIQNIIASQEKAGAYILLGAHYDTRLYADQDPDPKRLKDPVPGANDGASGVAVLLEIARVLPPDTDVPVKLVFFDAEDNGDIPGWDWILGSRMFVERMESRPCAVVILDMVGDKDLNLYYEKTSNQMMQREIWELAGAIGYEEYFIPDPKYAMIDDHTPFLNKGIPAVDIIDFDYPYWHTTSDTLDKISPHSLEVVGEVILKWLLDSGCPDSK